MTQPVKMLTGGLAAGLLGGGEPAPAPTINVPEPPGMVPSKTPNAKPTRKSMQSSFFSGAAMAQQQGGQTSGAGKTLIGA